MMKNKLCYANIIHFFTVKSSGLMNIQTFFLLSPGITSVSKICFQDIESFDQF